MFVQKTNHGGGSPFVRGLVGNQVLVLVDGIRLNNSTFRYGPNQYLATVDPGTVNRFEVLRGSGSVQYGSDALGGVIHVRNRDPLLSAAASCPRVGVTGRLMSQGMEQSIRLNLGVATPRSLSRGTSRFGTSATWWPAAIWAWNPRRAIAKPTWTFAAW